MYDDDRDALAAEYVLGTLSADERDQTEALLEIDPGFAEIVRVWERRLGELNVMVEAVEPPAEVWEKIRTGIDSAGLRSGIGAQTGPASGEQSAPQTMPFTAPDIAAAMTPESTPGPKFELAPKSKLELPREPAPDLAAAAPEDLDDSVPRDLDDTSPVAALASSLLPPELNVAAKTPPSPRPSPPMAPPPVKRGADIVYLERGVRRWRGITVAMSAIAALLVAYIAVTQFAPGLIPLSRQAQPAVATRAQPAGARLVAVLQQDPTSPAFLLTVDAQNRTLTVRRVSATPEAGRSYELWLISSKYPSPRSLGLVGGEEFTARPLPANVDVDTVRGASYAISLESAGGSSTGVPSGPILFTGKLVESLPGSPS
jgi:anti-sigma-K factor RskA